MAGIRVFSLLLLLLLLLLLSPAAATAAQQPPHPSPPTDPVVVTYRDGSVQGLASSFSRVFRGIPYAAPPVGQTGRWHDPKPPQAWPNVVRPAVHDGPGCPQTCHLPPHTCPPTQSEDCLYLNVFTPASGPGSNSKSSHAQLAPVLFFIHGGDYLMGYGGGPLYNGSYLANATGTVVVSINYRLGALGFISDGSGTDITGNYGIKDQVFAMQWVRDNIVAFNGDPDRVTIFGESAGGMSVAVHLVLPASKGLFHAAVIESDPFAVPLRTPKTYKAVHEAFAKKLGCAGSDTHCLRATSVSDILAAAALIEKDPLANLDRIIDMFVPWSPMADPNGGYLPGQPLQLIQQGKHHHVPTIMGCVRREAVLFIYQAFPDPVAAGLEYDLVLDIIFSFARGSDIRKHYPLPPNEKQDTRKEISKIATDVFFICATRNASRSMALSGSPTWLYNFDHVLSFGKAGWGPAFPFCWDVVCHSDELPFVFDSAQWMHNYTQQEVRLGHNMGQYWGGMAHGHDPNYLGTVPTKWPRFIPGPNEELFRFTAPEPSSAEQHFLNDACDFWDSVGYVWY